MPATCRAMIWSLPCLILIAAILAAFAATGLVLRWLRRRGILDNPNHRSSHVRPTPRGGGLGIVPVLIMAWAALILVGAAPLASLPALAAAAGLAALSWCDDRWNLPVRVRFLAQIAAVGLGILFLPGGGFVFQGWLPVPLDRVVCGFLWLWFTNLYNFMDGIDGITGAETAMIGGGIALVVGLDPMAAAGLFYPGLLLVGVSLAFLCWNWHPAKLFLGDVGSIPLGYVTGWLLLALAGSGLWAAALILPLYYLTDATVTLLRRLLRGEKIWQAHREHFYQQATRLGHSHARVVCWIIAADLALIGLAVLSGTMPVLALGLAALPVLAVLALMAGKVKSI